MMLLLITTGCNKKNREIVAWVKDEPITISELKHWMLLEKANVYNYFYRKYGVNDSDNFWTQKLGDEIPLVKLKEEALKKAERCKNQQILALDKGIIKNTSFDKIVGELNEVNAERKKKVNSGEPVYGPLQFTSRTYFFYVFDKMVIDLKNELSKKELKPDMEKLRMMQKSTKHSLTGKSGFLIMQYVDNNYERYIDKLVKSTDIKINRDVYEKVGMD